MKEKQSLLSQPRASLLRLYLLSPTPSSRQGDLEHTFGLPHVATAVLSRGAFFERSDGKVNQWHGEAFQTVSAIGNCCNQS